MLRSILFVTFCVLGAPVLAQSTEASGKPLTARAFHFDDYRSVVVLDLKTMRDTGVWDEINTSSLRMTAKMFEDQFGFSIDALDRVTMTRGKCRLDGRGRVFEEISVLEGNAALGEGDIGDSRYEAERIGASTLYVSKWGGDAFVVPNPRLHVYAPAELLRGVLAGKPRNGLPSADVMAFTAGAEDCLLYFVVDLKHDAGSRQELETFVGETLGDVEWPDGDAPTMIGGRVLATGDEDDPHLTLELVVRHGTVGKGLAVSEQAVDDGIGKLEKLSEARLFWPILRRIERSRSGTDAVWRVDLGRARHADGLLTTATPFLFLYGTTRAMQAQGLQVIEVEEVAEEEPANEKAKEKPGKGGGK